MPLKMGKSVQVIFGHTLILQRKVMRKTGFFDLRFLLATLRSNTKVAQVNIFAAIVQVGVNDDDIVRFFQHNFWSA